MKEVLVFVAFLAVAILLVIAITGVGDNASTLLEDAANQIPSTVDSVANMTTGAISLPHIG